MSDTYYVIGEDTASGIADAIREKKGYAASKKIKVGDFEEEIQGISGTLDQLINPDTPDGSVEVHSGVTAIPNQAFYNNPLKSKIGGACSFPNATSIGAQAFRGCNGITSIDAPNVVSLGNSYPLCEMSSLTYVNLPSCVTTGGYDFLSDVSLERVILNPNVSLSGSGFSGCTNLSKINSDEEGTFYLPHAVGTVNSLFKNCKKAKKIILTNMNGSTSAEGFYGCDLLEYVDFGMTTCSSQTNGLRAFNDCPKLTSVIYRHTTKHAYYSGAWNGTTDKSKITIYVPSTVLNDYLADTNWTGAGFAGIEAIADTFTIDGTTYNCDEGETFTTWIASANNTIGVHLIGDTVFNSDNTAYLTKNNIAIIQSNVVSGAYTWESL